MPENTQIKRFTRFTFGVAAVLAAGALLLRISAWERYASMDWPVFFNTLGLLTLAATGALEPAPRRWRLLLLGIAVALIFPSAFMILIR